MSDHSGRGVIKSADLNKSGNQVPSSKSKTKMLQEKLTSPREEKAKASRISREINVDWSSVKDTFDQDDKSGSSSGDGDGNKSGSKVSRKALALKKAREAHEAKRSAAGTEDASSPEKGDSVADTAAKAGKSSQDNESDGRRLSMFSQLASAVQEEVGFSDALSSSSPAALSSAETTAASSVSSANAKKKKGRSRRTSTATSPKTSSSGDAGAKKSGAGAKGKKRSNLSSASVTQRENDEEEEESSAAGNNSQDDGSESEDDYKEGSSDDADDYREESDDDADSASAAPDAAAAADDDDDDDDDDEEDDDDDSVSSSDDSDIDDEEDDLSAIASDPVKLLAVVEKERAKVSQGKATIASLIEQITEYQSIMEEEKQAVEQKLVEALDELQQADAAVEEREQELREFYEQRMKAMNSETISNLQTLMDELQTIEEANDSLTAKLNDERDISSEALAKVAQLEEDTSNLRTELKKAKAAAANVTASSSAAAAGDEEKEPGTSASPPPPGGSSSSPPRTPTLSRRSHHHRRGTGGGAGLTSAHSLPPLPPPVSVDLAALVADHDFDKLLAAAERLQATEATLRQRAEATVNAELFVRDRLSTVTGVFAELSSFVGLSGATPVPLPSSSSSIRSRSTTKSSSDRADSAAAVAPVIPREESKSRLSRGNSAKRLAVDKDKEREKEKDRKSSLATASTTAAASTPSPAPASSSKSGDALVNKMRALINSHSETLKALEGAFKAGPGQSLSPRQLSAVGGNQAYDSPPSLMPAASRRLSRVDQGTLSAATAGSLREINGQIKQMNDLKEPVTCQLEVGQHVLVAGAKGNLAVYDKKSTKLVETRKSGAPSISSLTFVARGGGTIWGTSKDNQIYIWSARTGQLLKVLDAHEGRVTALLVVGRYVWSTSTDMTFRVWSARNFKLHKTQTVQKFMISIHQHGDHVWMGTESVIMRWNPHDYKPVDTLRRHTKMVHNIITVKDTVWSASADKTICVWNPSTGACLQQIEAHESRVTALCSVGNFVFSCSQDKSIKVWKADSRKLSTVIKGAHDDAVTSLLFVGAGGADGDDDKQPPRDGKLWSTSLDKHISVWSLPAQVKSSLMGGSGGSRSGKAVNFDNRSAEVAGSQSPKIEVRLTPTPRKLTAEPQKGHEWNRVAPASNTSRELCYYCKKPLKGATEKCRVCARFAHATCVATAPTLLGCTGPPRPVSPASAGSAASSGSLSSSASGATVSSSSSAVAASSSSSATTAAPPRPPEIKTAAEQIKNLKMRKMVLVGQVGALSKQLAAPQLNDEGRKELSAMLVKAQSDLKDLDVQIVELGKYGADEKPLIALQAMAGNSSTSSPTSGANAAQSSSGSSALPRATSEGRLNSKSNGAGIPRASSELRTLSRGLGSAGDPLHKSTSDLRTVSSSGGRPGSFLMSSGSSRKNRKSMDVRLDTDERERSSAPDKSVQTWSARDLAKLNERKSKDERTERSERSDRSDRSDRERDRERRGTSSGGSGSDVKVVRDTRWDDVLLGVADFGPQQGVIIAHPVSLAGEALKASLPLEDDFQVLAKKWPKPQSQFTKWFDRRDRPQANFKLGSYQLVQVAEKTWVANMLVIDAKGDPVAEALVQCFANLSARARDLGACVHLSRFSAWTPMCTAAGGGSHSNRESRESLVNAISKVVKGARVYVHDARVPRPDPPFKRSR